MGTSYCILGGVLYKYNNIMLIYHILDMSRISTMSYPSDFFDTNYYGMLDPELTFDGKYDFYGEQNEEYNNKPLTYQKIFKQVHKHKMKES